MEPRRLSFSSHSEEGDLIVAWNCEPSGDWQTDSDLGATFADELTDYVKATDDTPMFGRVMREACAQNDGITAGFLGRMSELLKTSMKIALVVATTLLVGGTGNGLLWVL